MCDYHCMEILKHYFSALDYDSYSWKEWWFLNELGEYYGIQRENLLVLWVAGWVDGWVVGPFVGCGVCQLSCVQSRVCWFKANWNFGFTQFAKSLSSLAVYLLFLFCRCQFGHAEQGHITMPSEVYTFMNIVFCAWPTIYREIPGTVHSLPIISLLRQVMAHGPWQCPSILLLLCQWHYTTRPPSSCTHLFSSGICGRSNWQFNINGHQNNMLFKWGCRFG